MPDDVRKSSVAGSFYDSDPERLKNGIESYLENATTGPLNFQTEDVRAIMVPHAGYAYSATIAACGYKAITGKKCRTVFMVCNSHSAYFKGIAIDASSSWDTPLGNISLDMEIIGKMTESARGISLNREAHKDDHTLEVQLPFLQTVLGSGFKIVPILFGKTDADSYRDLAETIIQNSREDSLIVVSTDMSHYPKYEDANMIDKRTLELIAKLDIVGLDEHIDATLSSGIMNEQTLLCGIDGVRSIMEIAAKKAWAAEILKYQNSGDSRFGDKESVVGYGAVIFYNNGFKNF